MKMIKILIVDDHPLMREALCSALNSEDDLEVIAQANNAEDALEMLAEISPDVIMMDLMLPGMSGLDAIREIVNENPKARVLVNSSMEDEERILAAVRAGALGYYPKTAPRSYLLEAIRKVADGVPYMPMGITKKLFQGVRKLGGSEPEADPLTQLTSRQEEVLVLLAKGYADAEIAEALHLSLGTVRSHVHHIMQRLPVETRAQLVAYAHKRKLVE